MELEKSLQVRTTNIEGVFVVDLPVHGDNRGWFKENYQKAKMEALGLPSFKIVQNNMSYNANKGVTRGIHAEPWSKYISLAKGRVFEALVDLRAGSKSFGEVFTTELDCTQALFVPEGVGNAFQALEDDTIYTYLVTDHWSIEKKSSYTLVNVDDPDLNINWPIPLSEAKRSKADLGHPRLSEVVAYEGKHTLIIGANGQLGSAFRDFVAKNNLLRIDFVDKDELDLCDRSQIETFDWSKYKTIINCAAYTAVDAAETEDGRALAWKINAHAPSALAKIAAALDITLVHISSDYVFDGSQVEHSEEESFAPLGVYGQTKAAADLCVSACPRHYLLRTSWVIGDGKNFVKTMAALAQRVADPDDTLSSISVVDDQIGRLTFTETLVEAIWHLLESGAEYGTYNVTGEGASASWFDIAQIIFEKTIGTSRAVVPISTHDYVQTQAPASAPRPKYSTLDLKKIERSGYTPSKWETDLDKYLFRI